MRKLHQMVLIFPMITFAMSCASAEIWREGLVKTEKTELFQSLKGKDVILLGENHGLKTHQAQHLEVLHELRKLGRPVHVALEFFYYPDQVWVNLYRQEALSEAEFLRQIRWGNPSFDYYREQALFGERTWAINAPRSLTGQVARGGLASLSAELQYLMPPQFTIGRESYRQRFQAIMGGHIGEEAFERYFAAQSIWDDTMAWRIAMVQAQHPEAVIVVVVGEFHVQYGGGLPHRLSERGVHNVLTISQVNTSGLSVEEQKKEIMPHPEYGPRADWIWAAPAVD